MKIQETETKALTLTETLKAVTKIKTPDEYLKCGELWNAGKDMMKEIDNAYDSIIAKAHAAHKDAVAKKKSFYLPIEEATKFVKSIMSTYDEKREQLRREKEEKLREEAMKIEEEARLQAAIQAEKAGQKEAAEKILEAPIIEPIVVVPKETPKMNGGPVYRTIWDAEVIDFMALIKAVAEGKVSANSLLPNKVFLKSQATDLKTTMNFPGVRAFSRRV